MQDADRTGTIRTELMERLKALDPERGPENLADLAYRRAREALERALEEARAVRLQALEDARRTRDEETQALLQTLQSQRAAAEAEAEALLRQAEIEAEAIRSRAGRDAENIVRNAEEEAKSIRESASRTLEEARAVRDSVEAQRNEMDRLETEFNHTVAEIAERLGLTEKPSQGWWRRITGRSQGSKP